MVQYTQTRNEYCMYWVVVEERQESEAIAGGGAPDAAPAMISNSSWIPSKPGGCACTRHTLQFEPVENVHHMNHCHVTHTVL